LATEESVLNPAEDDRRQVPEPVRTPRSSERGVVFIWVLVALFILAVMLMAAVQPASIVAKRENEQELIFRGEEYTEAIRLYQTEHAGTFPTRLEDLLKEGPKRRRYIRRLYRNPFDPEGKWSLLAPGTTLVSVDEAGKTIYTPQGGTATRGGTTTAPPQGTGSTRGTGGATGVGRGGQGLPGGKNKVLPFRIDGKEGQPILGVYCRLEDRSFVEYRGASKYSEWFFSPLVIPPPQGPLKQGNSDKTAR
jgi:type II secretory pathway pseudopilin PulG